MNGKKMDISNPIHLVIHTSFVISVMVCIFSMLKRLHQHDQLILSLEMKLNDKADRYATKQKSPLEKDAQHLMVKKVLTAYEVLYQQLPCRIIEIVEMQMLQTLDNMDNKSLDEKVVYLFEILTYKRIDECIQKDTKEYEARLKKNLMENKIEEQNGKNN
jgi:hypothetical protein